MESRPLKQQIALIVDTMGMQGLVERRTAAEEVYRTTTDDYWSEGDTREARVQYLMTEITAYMNTPLASEDINRIMPRVPAEYRAFLETMPRYICISERGGRGAKHVMAWRASPDDWDSNFQLKAFVAERATISRDASRAMRDLLIANHANCLADLSASAAE